MQVVNLFGDEWSAGRDSEKIGIFAKGQHLYVRRESGVDYFDGED